MQISCSPERWASEKKRNFVMLAIYLCLSYSLLYVGVLIFTHSGFFAWTLFVLILLFLLNVIIRGPFSPSPHPLLKLQLIIGVFGWTILDIVLIRGIFMWEGEEINYLPLRIFISVYLIPFFFFKFVVCFVMICDKWASSWQVLPIRRRAG